MDEDPEHEQRIDQNILNEADELFAESNATEDQDENQAVDPDMKKAEKLKAENYDLWQENEKLNEENQQLRNELTKLQEKHDKLASLSRDRLNDIRTDYTRIENENQKLNSDIEKLSVDYDAAKILVDEYQKQDDNYKKSMNDMRAMCDALTKNVNDLKDKNISILGELELVREKHVGSKQDYDKIVRENNSLKDDLINVLNDKDLSDKEILRLKAKMTELVTAKKLTDEKCEHLNTRCSNLQLDIKKFEATEQMSNERLQLLKKEHDVKDSENKLKVQNVFAKFKELQMQNKNVLEQFKQQSKQCESLNDQNKQLLAQIETYRLDNEQLAQQLAQLNMKQKRLALELDSVRSFEVLNKSEDALKMNDTLINLTEQLSQLRRNHSHVLTENHRIKEMLIEKDSVLSTLGYERHQLHDRLIKNENTIAQMEHLLSGVQKHNRTPLSLQQAGMNTFTPLGRASYNENYSNPSNSRNTPLVKNKNTFVLPDI
jgi:chromosome segregation ATPase